MNFCHQLSVYSLQIGTLLGIIFTMFAFSKIGKKHREETSYTAVVGVSLLCVINVFLGDQLHGVMNLVNCSPMINTLWGALVFAAIITAALMIVGKSLKVKSVEPKTLLICFFVGLALANLVGMALDQQCATQVQPTTRHHYD